MAAPTMVGLPDVLPADPTDAQLLDMVASLLAAMPGPQVGAPLSQVIEYLCAAVCPTGAPERAHRLEFELAEYLADWRVLRHSQTSPAELDRFATDAPLTFLHAALLGCARCQQAEMAIGGAR